MPEEVGSVAKSTLKANRFRRVALIFDQHTIGMADTYFDKEILERFLGHHLEIPEKRRDTEVGYRCNFRERDIFPVPPQDIMIHVVDAISLFSIHMVSSLSHRYH